MSTEPVLIVGAGPTGLVLALRLARHGVAFRLIDKAAGPGLASRAMAVHARTLEFYRQIGFGDEMARRGVRIETALVREGGAERTRLSLRDIGTGLSPYPFVLAFPQDDHERFLGERLAAAGGAVEWGVALESFTQTDSRVEAVLDNKGARETAAFAYVCGCDGAHSRVRETLRLGFPGGTYQHLHYVADARLAGTPDEDLYVNIGAESFALNLPVRSSGMHRLIGIAPEEAGRALTFDDVRPQAERLLGVRVASVNWFSTYRVHHRVASRFRAGRGFIAGDAGHVHSPVGGQGMNTGIGDAVNLAWKIAAVLQGRAGPALLDTYEAERIPFARRLIATTDRVFQAIVSEGLDGQAVRRLLLPYGLPALAAFRPCAGPFSRRCRRSASPTAAAR